MSEGVGMSSCCLSGKVKSGRPQGTETDIAGLNTYIAEPKDGSKAKTVIFIVDSMPSHLPQTLNSPNQPQEHLLHYLLRY